MISTVIGFGTTMAVGFGVQPYDFSFHKNTANPPRTNVIVNETVDVSLEKDDTSKLIAETKTDIVMDTKTDSETITVPAVQTTGTIKGNAQTEAQTRSNDSPNPTVAPAAQNNNPSPTVVPTIAQNNTPASEEKKPNETASAKEEQTEKGKPEDKKTEAKIKVEVKDLVNGKVKLF